MNPSWIDSVMRRAGRSAAASSSFAATPAEARCFALQGNHDACLQNKMCMVNARGGCQPTTASEELRRALTKYNGLKLTIVSVLVLYVIIITVLHQSTADDNEPQRRKYEFVQNVLFGHTGVMVYIFTLIIFTLLLIIFMPFLSKVWDYRGRTKARLTHLLDTITTTS